MTATMLPPETLESSATPATRRHWYRRLRTAVERPAARVALTLAGRVVRPATAAKLTALARGERTLAGPPAACDGWQPGLVNEAAICARMNLDVPVSELSARYVTRASLRTDASILARWMWARMLGADNEVAARDRSFPLLGVRVNNMTMQEAVAMLAGAVEVQRAAAMIDDVRPAGEARLAAPVQVAFVNAHNLNVACEHAEYARALRSVDYVLPDGIGVKLAARMKGHALRHNLNGTDLFAPLMSALGELHAGVFVLGAEPAVLARAIAAIERDHPGVRVLGSRDGYFDRTDEPALREAINASGADVVIVGMGTPRQELWMARNVGQLRVGAVLCLGGLLDFLGGKNARAPMWMRQAGLEWIYRIVQEPRRMWRRYVVGNPKFLWRAWCESRRRPSPK